MNTALAHLCVSFLLCTEGPNQVSPQEVLLLPEEEAALPRIPPSWTGWSIGMHCSCLVHFFLCQSHWVGQSLKMFRFWSSENLYNGIFHTLILYFVKCRSICFSTCLSWIYSWLKSNFKCRIQHQLKLLLCTIPYHILYDNLFWPLSPSVMSIFLCWCAKKSQRSLKI